MSHGDLATWAGTTLRADEGPRESSQTPVTLPSATRACLGEGFRPRPTPEAWWGTVGPENPGEREVVRVAGSAGPEQLLLGKMPLARWCEDEAAGASLAALAPLRRAALCPSPPCVRAPALSVWLLELPLRLRLGGHLHLPGKPVCVPPVSPRSHRQPAPGTWAVAAGGSCSWAPPLSASPLLLKGPGAPSPASSLPLGGCGGVDCGARGTGQGA